MSGRKLAFVAVIALGGSHAHAATLVFNDTFETASPAGTQAAGWSGSTFGVQTAFVHDPAGNANDPRPDPAYSNKDFSDFDNARYGDKAGRTDRVTTKALDSAISYDTDWTLSFDALHSRYSRTLRLGLYTSAATGGVGSTTGYQILWTNGNINQFLGRGYAHVNDTTSMTAGVTNLGLPVGTGPGQSNNSVLNTANASTPHFATGYATSGALYDSTNTNWTGMAHFVLEYDYTPAVGEQAATARLKLFIDGVLYKDVFDPTPMTSGAFTNVGINGNLYSYFDNIQVSVVPEPASIGGMAVVGLAALCRRRRA